LSPRIRYFLGRTGSGKSYRMMQEIVADLKEGGDYPLILLVPEQFTLQAERDLIAKMNLPGIMRAEVLSFTRLSYRVFNEVGGLTRTTVSAQGKNMILRKIMIENMDSLTIYKKAADKQGFTDKVSSILASFKQQGIGPEDLKKAAEDLDESGTALKIKDLVLLYEKFNEYLQGRYLDTEDRINLFIEKMGHSQYIRQARIWIDGFTTYSAQSLRIIEKLMGLARETTISFTVNNDDEPDRDLFYLSAQSYRKIRAIARESGIGEEVVHFAASSGCSGKKHELEFLEKELYAYPYRIYRGEINHIRLFASTNVQAEVENAAREVVTLAREKELRWKDIAVVCNNTETYGKLLTRIFTQYGIPFFMDSKRSIMANPLVQLILSALAVLEHDFRPEDVFRLMKTGLNNISLDCCEQMENYALQYGLIGGQWRRPLVRGDEAWRTELEPWREALVEPLIKLRQKTRGLVPCMKMNEAVNDFLVELGVESKLSTWIEKLNTAGEYALASENTQIWNIVMEIFDQLDEFMGDQEMQLKDYAKVLEAGFSTYEVGLIPTTVDQVLVGSIQRSKSHDIKALLVLGANDGVLPSAREEEELLSAAEKELLQENGLDLGYTREKQFMEERFLIYSVLGKPHDYLYLSWSLADLEGKAMHPSPLVDRLTKLLPGIKVSSDLSNAGSAIDNIQTPASTFNNLVNSLRDMIDGKPVDDLWWDVYNWYYDHSEWLELREMVIKGFNHTNQTNYIDSKTAARLYGSKLYPSVSRLEQYAACPFAHFIHYGLTPHERKMYSMDWPDMGEMLHKSLHLFANALEHHGLQWNTLEQTDCHAIMDGVMDSLIDEYGDGVLTSNHRYRYLGRRLKRIGRRAVWTLTEHLQKGEFVPGEFEVRFGRGGKFPPIRVELADGQQLFIEGRIDRVDFWQAEDAVYARIIDYKTGDKKLDISAIYYGLSLQLLIYLQAVLAAGRTAGQPVKPGGIFYFKIDDPIVNMENVAGSVEKALARQLRMRGLVLKDVSVASAMDRDIAASDVIPVGLTRQGDFDRYSSVVDESDFMALLQHAMGLVRAMGMEILKGRVAIDPFSKDGQNACTYCPYWSICHFDRLLPDNNFRILKSPGDDEIIARVRKEAANNAQLD
jgi:ATP-dependent helicase/nuclease subunit B